MNNPLTNTDHHRPLLSTKLEQVRNKVQQQQFKQALNLLDSMDVGTSTYVDSSSRHSATEIQFLRGLCLECLDQFPQALEAYDRCLDINQDCKEAWHNRARLLCVLERENEANFNLAKLQRLLNRDLAMTMENARASLSIPDQDNENGHSENTVRFSAMGEFAEIRVLQSPVSRYLCIADQIQGGYWLEQGQPSPIPSSTYVAGLLFAASSPAIHKVLILGLGAACGAVALLAAYPQLDITVIELDLKIISAAKQQFPWVNHYQKNGRLNIIHGDGFSYLFNTQQTFDLCFVDIFCGTATLPGELSDKTVFQQLKRIAQHNVFNVILKDRWTAVEEHLHQWSAQGQTIKHVLPIEPLVEGEDVWLKRARPINYLLCSKRIAPVAAKPAVPLCSPYLMRACQREINQLQHRAIAL